MRKITIITISCILAACSSAPQKSSSGPSAVASTTPAAEVYVPATNVNQFVQQMVRQYHFDAAALTAVLSQAQVNTHLINMMNHPSEKRLAWYQYQALFITPQVIQKGQVFLQKNQHAFHLATERYGVPPSIIAAILGVETVYGANEGHISALNSLYTLAFAYPQRQTYFQKELAQYLLMTREAGFDPLTVQGSYAGALGMPQFMPSSYREYAVSNTRAYPNLFSNPEDAILSVGNYFAKKGWQAGQPVALQVIDLHDRPIPEALVNQTLTIKQFKAAGVVPINLGHSKKDQSLQAKLLCLQGKVGPEYWLVFHNFQVIKRYNASDLYAMAVFQLSQFVSND